MVSESYACKISSEYSPLAGRNYSEAQHENPRGNFATLNARDFVQARGYFVQGKEIGYEREKVSLPYADPRSAKEDTLRFTQPALSLREAVKRISLN